MSVVRSAVAAVELTVAVVGIAITVSRHPLVRAGLRAAPHLMTPQMKQRAADVIVPSRLFIDYNEREGTLPGFVEGFTNVARDEHRHVAFGARFLRDMAREDPRYGAAIQRALVEVAPVAEGVLKPKWAPEDESIELFGTSIAQTRAFALKALERRMKVIGLVTAA